LSRTLSLRTLQTVLTARHRQEGRHHHRNSPGSTDPAMFQKSFWISQGFQTALSNNHIKMPVNI